MGANGVTVQKCMAQRPTLDAIITGINPADLRDVGKGVADVEPEPIQILPLLSGDWWSYVIGNDLRLVEQVLNDKHDRCFHCTKHKHEH